MFNHARFLIEAVVSDCTSTSTVRRYTDVDSTVGRFILLISIILINMRQQKGDCASQCNLLNYVAKRLH
jgi:hypothetical protein